MNVLSALYQNEGKPSETLFFGLAWNSKKI